MSPLKYHRPKDAGEALRLLGEGVPLGGGTSLVTRRKNLAAVVDLQDLELDGCLISNGTAVFGAAVTLQELYTMGRPLPAALLEAARLEAALNLRNMATLGGTLMSGDGRSTLLTALLALDTVVSLEPGAIEVRLDDLLNERKTRARLITSLRFELPLAMGLEHVGRTPTDKPNLCVVAVRTADGVRLALGGHGSRPLLLAGVPADEIAAAASAAYRQAGDDWASAEYRQDVAGKLSERLLQEVGNG